MPKTPTPLDPPLSEKDRKQAEREARLAKNLRDNLRRRKIAGRKIAAEKQGVTDAPKSS